MRGVPVVAGLGVDLERHGQLHRRVAARSMISRDERHGLRDLGLRRLEDQLVVHLQQHLRAMSFASASASSMRIMARRMMSAAVPWIGALIEARSTKARSDGFDDFACGKWIFRPNSVET